MIGLSYKEIESREKELYFKYYGDEFRIKENLKQPWTQEDTQEMNELSFRRWVNSCLIYSCDFYFEAERLTRYDSCIGQSTLDLYKVQLKRALEIIEEQKERFKTAVVHRDVGTDSEGVSYNSCEWN